MDKWDFARLVESIQQAGEIRNGLREQGRVIELPQFDLSDYLRFLPILKQAPQATIWLTYDQEADVMCINFQKPSIATDSELTDDDIIIRYADDEVIGFTILHARQR